MLPHACVRAGVLVRSIAAASDESGVLQVDDIILRIDGQQVFLCMSGVGGGGGSV